MKIFAIAVFVLLSLAACTVSFSPTAENKQPEMTQGTTAQQVEVIRTAREYLALIDEHRYDETWERSGSSLKASSNKFIWTNMLKAASKVIGVTATRDVEGLGFSTRIDQNVPVGSYALVQFKSQSGRFTATEKIVMQEENGTWKIIGYFINKRAESRAST